MLGRLFSLHSFACLNISLQFIQLLLFDQPGPGALFLCLANCRYYGQKDGDGDRLCQMAAILQLPNGLTGTCTRSSLILRLYSKAVWRKENFVRWGRGKRGTALEKNATFIVLFALNFQPTGKTGCARFEIEWNHYKRYLIQIK